MIKSIKNIDMPQIINRTSESPLWNLILGLDKAISYLDKKSTWLAYEKTVELKSIRKILFAKLQSGESYSNDKISVQKNEIQEILNRHRINFLPYFQTKSSKAFDIEYNKLNRFTEHQDNKARTDYIQKNQQINQILAMDTRNEVVQLLTASKKVLSHLAKKKLNNQINIERKNQLNNNIRHLEAIMEKDNYNYDEIFKIKTDIVKKSLYFLIKTNTRSTKIFIQELRKMERFQQDYHNLKKQNEIAIPNNAIIKPLITALKAVQKSNNSSATKNAKLNSDIITLERLSYQKTVDAGILQSEICGIINNLKTHYWLSFGRDTISYKIFLSNFLSLKNNLNNDSLEDIISQHQFIIGGDKEIELLSDRLYEHINKTYQIYNFKLDNLPTDQQQSQKATIIKARLETIIKEHISKNSKLNQIIVKELMTDILTKVTISPLNNPITETYLQNRLNAIDSFEHGLTETHFMSIVESLSLTPKFLASKPADDKYLTTEVYDKLYKIYQQIRDQKPTVSKYLQNLLPQFEAILIGYAKSNADNVHQIIIADIKQKLNMANNFINNSGDIKYIKTIQNLDQITYQTVTTTAEQYIKALFLIESPVKEFETICQHICKLESKDINQVFQIIEHLDANNLADKYIFYAYLNRYISYLNKDPSQIDYEKLSTLYSRFLQIANVEDPNNYSKFAILSTAKDFTKLIFKLKTLTLYITNEDNQPPIDHYVTYINKTAQLQWSLDELYGYIANQLPLSETFKTNIINYKQLTTIDNPFSQMISSADAKTLEEKFPHANISYSNTYQQNFDNIISYIDSSNQHNSFIDSFKTFYSQLKQKYLAVSGEIDNNQRFNFRNQLNALGTKHKSDQNINLGQDILSNLSDNFDNFDNTKQWLLQNPRRIDNILKDMFTKEKNHPLLSKLAEMFNATTEQQDQEIDKNIASYLQQIALEKSIAAKTNEDGIKLLDYILRLDKAIIRLRKKHSITAINKLLKLIAIKEDLMEKLLQGKIYTKDEFSAQEAKILAVLSDYRGIIKLGKTKSAKLFDQKVVMDKHDDMHHWIFDVKLANLTMALEQTISHLDKKTSPKYIKLSGELNKHKNQLARSQDQYQFNQLQADILSSLATDKTIRKLFLTNLNKVSELQQENYMSTSKFSQDDNIDISQLKLIDPIIEAFTFVTHAYHRQYSSNYQQILTKLKLLATKKYIAPDAISRLFANISVSSEFYRTFIEKYIALKYPLDTPDNNTLEQILAQHQLIIGGKQQIKHLSNIIVTKINSYNLSFLNNIDPNEVTKLIKQHLRDNNQRIKPELLQNEILIKIIKKKQLVPQNNNQFAVNDTEQSLQQALNNIQDFESLRCFNAESYLYLYQYLICAEQFLSANNNQFTADHHTKLYAIYKQIKAKELQLPNYFKTKILPLYEEIINNSALYVKDNQLYLHDLIDNDIRNKLQSYLTKINNEDKLLIKGGNQTYTCQSIDEYITNTVIGKKKFSQEIYQNIVNFNFADFNINKKYLRDITNIVSDDEYCFKILQMLQYLDTFATPDDYWVIQNKYIAQQLKRQCTIEDIKAIEQAFKHFMTRVGENSTPDVDSIISRVGENSTPDVDSIIYKFTMLIIRIKINEVYYNKNKQLMYDAECSKFANFALEELHNFLYQAIKPENTSWDVIFNDYFRRRIQNQNPTQPKINELGEDPFQTILSKDDFSLYKNKFPAFNICQISTYKDVFDQIINSYLYNSTNSTNIQFNGETLETKYRQLSNKYVTHITSVNTRVKDEVLVYDENINKKEFTQLLQLPNLIDEVSEQNNNFETLDQNRITFDLDVCRYNDEHLNAFTNPRLMSVMLYNLCQDYDIATIASLKRIFDPALKKSSDATIQNSSLYGEKVNVLNQGIASYLRQMYYEKMK
jgi:hypothetical protein